MFGSGGGADQLVGGPAGGMEDELLGRRGDDRLSGGEAADHLDGSGADRLVGEWGRTPSGAEKDRTPR